MTIAFTEPMTKADLVDSVEFFNGRKIDTDIRAAIDELVAEIKRCHVVIKDNEDLINELIKVNSQQSVDLIKRRIEIRNLKEDVEDLSY